ncbi:MAG: hypothetical protein IK077_03440 [Thermoguttaceae bacterium]|nr:hypothetical protein [Thermoguttaceae bacterium]
MINEITTLTYLIQDSLHDLDRHVDETGKVILDTLHKDFSAMRNYLSQLREKQERLFDPSLSKRSLK